MRAVSDLLAGHKPALLKLCIGAVLVLLIGTSILPAAQRYFLQRTSDASEATLRIVVEGLRGTLDRFEPLPQLIAERPILIDLLEDPTNQGVLPFVNEQLRLTAMTLGVSDVYLMDISGMTIAASSYRKERSFVGRNFNYRPYFRQAIEGGLGQYFALGTTSGERGYFFAAPVLKNTRIIGVVTVKFNVAQFEESWRGGTSEIIVADLADVVFMSSREDWHFKTLSPLEGSAFSQIAATRQYPLDRLVDLPNRVQPLTERATLMTVEGEDFVLNSTLLPDVGWRILHLTPAGPARTQALLVLSLAGLLILFGALVALILAQRRVRARERAEEERAAKEILEARVAQRTTDLNEANKKLSQEVVERSDAEERLRKTQKELVQAGKLAALGQMSAALSHEINQPLTALKSYAKNAAAFMDRGRTDDARSNIEHISKMADRMAALSAHLRNFARRPQETVRSIDAKLVVQDAIELMGSRLRSAGATLRYEAPDDPHWVLGGRLRLEQVVVNLLSNALDAMDGKPNPVIEIALFRTGSDRIRITVSDNGPGLREDVLSRLFDPFFTTKDPGQGLGLGLSISFNIVEDFGGRLLAENSPDGGAVFSIDLAAAEAPSENETLAAE
ncbi:MAG: ATP-binding protein [Pseudomonadota bacterium]